MRSAVQVLREAQELVVLTGAGVSADSGVATFRDAGGLWEGQPVEALATPAAWRRDPARVWRFYQQRRRQLLGVSPNPAHLALVGLERALHERGCRYTLISQNVDDLHQRAGSRPLSMHGQLFELTCERCGAVSTDRSALDPEACVPCACCGFERLRPNVVWFGETPRHLEAIELALKSADCFFAIGTSGLVYPAAGLLHVARANGARTLVNSLDAPANLDARDVFLPGRAAEVLPALIAAAFGPQS
jgi:NAD-dependent deacetylase